MSWSKLVRAGILLSIQSCNYHACPREEIDFELSTVQEDGDGSDDVVNHYKHGDSTLRMMAM